MRDARLPVLDERGLMPLAEARELLAGAAVFRRGEGRMIGGRFVLESDRLWAALLSLEDAAEFVTHARRLHWETNVRGTHNLAPYERYGDGILPWIAARVNEAGILDNVPWCVLPCLLASGSKDAFDVAATVRDPGVLRRCSAVEESRSMKGRPLEPHPEFGDELGPLEVAMLGLEPDEVFLGAERLAEVLGLPATAEALFVLDRWSGPEMEEPAATAQDLVLAVEALRERRAITEAITPRSPEDHLRERIELLGGRGAAW